MLRITTETVLKIYHYLLQYDMIEINNALNLENLVQFDSFKFLIN